MCHKYWEGEIPSKHQLEEIDFEIINEIKSAPKIISEHIKNYKFRFAIQAFMDLARAGNKYLADTEPWKLFKKTEHVERTETILNISIQLTATLSILCEPFMPFTSKKLCEMLNMKCGDWKAAGNLDSILPGHLLKKPSLLFSIIEDSAIEQQVLKLKK